MGLYADDVAAITGGDVNDRDYFQVKFDMMMLDLAIRQRQPEGRIGFNLVSTQRNIADIAKKYPNHEGIKQWQAKVDDIIKKIDSNADRGAAWKPGCPWDESNFVQYWVNFYTAREAQKNNERTNAKMYLSNVKQNMEFLSRPERLKDYPQELRQWFEESKGAVERMDTELSA